MLLIALTLTGCQRSEVDRLLGDLKSNDYPARRRAVFALGDRRHADARIVPALITLLDDVDPEIRRGSCRGLEQRGAVAAQQRLEAHLSDPDTSVRRAAAFALHTLTPDSTAYHPELLAAMRSGDGGVIQAVAQWRPQAVWATETLIGLLRDRRPGIRRLAAAALGQLGASTPEVTAALERLASDPDDRVREAVAAALAKLRE